ncbi:MAG: twin-arginine translocation signal domain-containing protein [Desulfobacter sp.]|nr:MAG: twin-arginine translocation signal domain-containing protein [Desulfobacter sp.]
MMTHQKKGKERRQFLKSATTATMAAGAASLGSIFLKPAAAEDKKNMRALRINTEKRTNHLIHPPNISIAAQIILTTKPRFMRL